MVDQTIAYRHSADAMVSPIGADIVALHLPSGQCFGMSEVSAAVWRWLEAPASLEQLIARARDEYEVDEARCRAEIGALIDQLCAAGLIEVAPPGQRQ